MRTFVSGLLVVILALILGVAVFAQDTSQQGSTAGQSGDIMYDSDLMLNLYVANRFFGFDRFMQELTTRGADPSRMVDLNRFNRGQFAPLFIIIEAPVVATGNQSGQAGQTGQTAGRGLNFTEEQRNNILAILVLDEPTFQTEFRNRLPQSSGAPAATDLTPGAVAGESPECAQLRSALHRFWSALAIEDVSSGMTMGIGGQAQVSGTGEAGEQTGTGALAEAGTVNVGLIEYQIDMPASVPAGTVTFNITNNGTMEHSFHIEGNGIDQELEPHLQPGESGTLTVDLAPGTYTVYCPVEDHRSRGMELQLTVTEGEQSSSGAANATATPSS